jgi:hypothetical protein
MHHHANGPQGGDPKPSQSLLAVDERGGASSKTKSPEIRQSSGGGTYHAIADIIVGERHRRDLGDIDGLARSIADVGLLHPIVIDSHGRLIAGKRRLNAVRQLGWMRVVDLDKIVLGEFAENSQRKDFLPSEIDAIRRSIEPIERAAAERRMTLGKISPGSNAGRVRDKIGAFAGVSGRTVEKIGQVMQAAESQPDKFGTLVEDLDRYRGVDRAYRKLCQLRDQERVAGLTPIEGKFRTIVLDPPWGTVSQDIWGRGADKYSMMSRLEAQRSAEPSASAAISALAAVAICAS